MSKQNAGERRACLFDCMMSVVKDAPCRKRGKCIYPDQCKEVEKEIRSLIENQPRDDVFIQHIQQHLNPGQGVICKICGKTANEIIKEASDG